MIFMIFSHAFMSTFSPEAEGFKFLTFSKLVRASIGSMDALFNSLRVQLCLWNLCGLGVYLSGLVAAVFFFFFFSVSSCFVPVLSAVGCVQPLVSGTAMVVSNMGLLCVQLHP
jgi:hypothetical protein